MYSVIMSLKCHFYTQCRDAKSAKGNVHALLNLLSNPHFVWDPELLSSKQNVAVDNVYFIQPCTNIACII